MKPSLDTAIHLLHAATHGALATHSVQLPDYPFASALPFMPDAAHRPVFLLSRLAEHTKNLLANPRAGFLVTLADAADVLNAPRMTLLGDVLPVEAEPELAARFVRYHPEAEQYLALGDFAFFRLTPRRVRYIGGFAQMGWIEEPEWSGAPVLPAADEAALLERFGTLPPATTLLGIDCYGFDIERGGKRERHRFPAAAGTDEIAASMKPALDALVSK